MLLLSKADYSEKDPFGKAGQRYCIILVIFKSEMTLFLSILVAFVA